MKGRDVMNRTADLKHKEVINITDGRRLGFVCDVEINLESGSIEGLVIPGGGKFFGFIGRDNEFVIPWEKIRKIGEDIILVDMDERFLRKYFDY